MDMNEIKEIFFQECEEQLAEGRVATVVEIGEQRAPSM